MSYKVIAVKYTIKNSNGYRKLEQLKYHFKTNVYVKEVKLNILFFIKIKWSDIVGVYKLLSEFETYF